MDVKRYYDYTAAQIREALLAHEVTARELAQAAFDRVAAIDGEGPEQGVHAFLELTPQLAFVTAQHIDSLIEQGRGSELGALAGVPVAFKDNMNVEGTHTTCSSRMLENYVSPYTATCVQRMLDADALCIGKLNMDEFAFGSSTETSAFGPSRNPWDLERVPGGSSGGSAAAVAAGMVNIALGSDTGGSIRQPAAFCGVVGIKPTYGVVSRYGVVAFGSSLDQVGPFARTVEDAALALDVIAGRDEHDCTSQPVDPCFATAAGRGNGEGAHGMRIGVVPAWMDAAGLDPETRACLEKAADFLREQGAEIVDVELPHAAVAMSAYYVLGPCEAFSNLARFDSVRYGYAAKGCTNLTQQYDESRAAGFGAEAKRRILLGSYLLSSGVYDTYYVAAQKARTLITQDYARAFSQVDCILAPASPRTAFKFGEISNPEEMHLSDMYTISINIAGNGGLSVPVGLDDKGLPIGAQVIAPAFKDSAMVRVAAALEKACGSLGVAPAYRKVMAQASDTFEAALRADCEESASCDSVAADPSQLSQKSTLLILEEKEGE